MGGGEGQLLQLRRRLPDADLGETSFTTPLQIYTKSFQRDPITRDGMFYGAQGLKARRFNAQGAFRCEVRVELSVENFHVWKLPKMRVHDLSGPLTHQKMPVSFGDKGGKVAGRSDLAFANVGQLVYAILLQGDAESIDRTNHALRISWRADQSSKFH